ncbi:hypothetical protein [Paenibacillus sp. MMS18-CY102]|uniref:hypothetical protein n=1 Tax=Paenibacillus sp. MMS18-CY102 TaxID=2682849 RepID=UPI00136568B6|nr:hypothetical protein [Paenibacillus sp. MMS18-CY102]MWC29496.1 hypothetical protein [Paenibacillus sp. MMS18-CY102]
MSKLVSAKINWVPTECGGKKRFPLREYSTAAHFHADEADRDWSVVLIMREHLDNYEMICDLAFLFEDAESSCLIYVGSTFELYESKKVADGIIIQC